MSARDVPLLLHEEVLLLALSEEKGTIECGAWYQQAVGAAVLAELLLAGLVRLEGHGRKARVVPAGGRPLGDPLLDEWLERIRSDSKRRRLDHWAGKASGTRDLKSRVARGLAKKGVLCVEEQRVLLVFPRTVYPERDARPERAIRARLHGAVFGDAHDLDPRTVVLVSLARSTGLLDVAFGKKALKPRKRRIESIVNGEETGRAAKRLVEAVQAAILVTCVLPAAVS